MQNDLLSQLHDIRGIEPVSWWPPALGWWGLLSLLLLVWAGIVLYRRHKKMKAARWQTHIKTLFTKLRAEQNPKKKTAAISELLRRLAIRQYGRDACAGLEGQAWLAWLEAHDPSGFNWKKNGTLLTEAPYAPDSTIPANDLEPLIRAAERWVR